MSCGGRNLSSLFAPGGENVINMTFISSSLLHCTVRTHIGAEHMNDTWTYVSDILWICFAKTLTYYCLIMKDQSLTICIQWHSIFLRFPYPVSNYSFMHLQASRFVYVFWKRGQVQYQEPCMCLFKVRDTTYDIRPSEVPFNCGWMGLLPDT